ncbi:MAG TPA: histidinol-phosphatase [Olsenella sp.]|nr:histidinol-phosphatase [Olsenella sp.]
MPFSDQTFLAPGGNRYKGNLHSHTTNSDGCLTPAESVAAFRAHGYDFLCLSEHDLYTDYSDAFDDEGFVILPGLEASAYLYADESESVRLRCHHMHGILGTDEMVAAAPRRFSHMERLEPIRCHGSWDGEAVASELARRLAERGCAVTYNHPIWSRVEPGEFCGAEGYFALELFNYGTVNESGTGFDTTYWDLMLRRGRRVLGFASDDNHNEGLFDDAFGGWVVVRAKALSRDAIVRALLAGDYFSSSGPELLSWGVEAGRVWVECSPCERVNLVAGGPINAGGTVIAQAGTEGLKHAEFELRGGETYLRVECVDARGRTAWSNPAFADEA